MGVLVTFTVNSRLSLNRGEALVTSRKAVSKLRRSMDPRERMPRSIVREMFKLVSGLTASVPATQYEEFHPLTLRLLRNFIERRNVY